jgi:hypothetical protein
MPLPLLMLIAKFILANGTRAGVRKYGPQLVKQALKKMRAKEKVIARRVPHSTKRSSEASRSRALENQLKQERGIRLEAEFDSPLDILNPPIEGVPLKFQRGGPVGRGGSYREQPNLPSRGDPVQDAVDAAVGGGTTPDTTDFDFDAWLAQSNLNSGIAPPPAAEASMLAQAIAGYEGEYREDYDLNKDGEIDVLDSIWQMQIEGGLRNPDGTPVTTTAPVFPSTTTEPGMDTVGPAGTVIDPVQDAVDAATGTKPLPSSYGAVDNWGEPGYTAYDPADQFIDPVGSFVEDPVSPFMDEDPSTDTWTAPVVDVLPTAGAGAGGDPTTDFAPVNNLFEPTTGDPYPVGIIDPNFTAPVTGTDPNAPGPDPTHFDYDAGTYNPPDTTGAVDDMTTTTGVGDMPTTNVVGDMTTTTGGFPDSPFEGQVYMDGDNVTWIFVQGEWREVGPTGDTPPVTTAPTVTDPTVTDPTVTDPTVTDPTVTDPTVTDPTVTDPTVTGQSEVDKLNALIAEMQAKQEAERAAWEAQTAAATGKYTLTGPSIGYNPYVSGQYQSDPYGAAGVPDLGGITTIPTPADWQPPTLQPWQAPTQTSNPWGK